MTLWAAVTYVLGAQWTMFEQYHYGWAVPFICLFFAWERARSREQGAGGRQLAAGAAFRHPTSDRRPLTSVLCFLLSAFCFPASWFLQQANPLWRAASYGLVLGAAGLTLSLVAILYGGSPMRRFVFPVLFFFVAVPWPTPVEGSVTRGLMGLNTSLVVELLNAFGIPAIPHGNVIEISTGMVGIEEACSGIRSLQATLMLGLFFGEFFRLRWGRRLALIVAGVGFAMVSNLCRTYFLVWIAARNGVPAIHQWHDPAGVFVLLVCFTGIWLLAMGLKQKVESQKQKAEMGGQMGAGDSSSSSNPGQAASMGRNMEKEAPMAPSSDSRAEALAKADDPPTSDLRPLISASGAPCSILYARLFPLSTFCFLLFVFASTEVWFRVHERRGELTQWSAHWPANEPSFQVQSISPTTKDIMEYDAADAASWSDADGHNWFGFYFRWLPASHFYGRVKVALAKGHSPEICLQSAGWKLESELEPALANVQSGFSVPFRRYTFNAGGRTTYVFFAVVEDQVNGAAPGLFRMTSWDRVRAALAGSRNFGERSIEVAVSGYDSADDAWSAFQSQIPHWVAVGF